MLKKVAIIYGIVFLLIGILGFVPGITVHNMLLGIFHVNVWHNIIHILSGLIAFWVAVTSNRASQIYFQVFGIIYAIVAILGFFYDYRSIFGFIANNPADAWLHTIIAIITLYFGFRKKLARN